MVIGFVAMGAASVATIATWDENAEGWISSTLHLKLAIVNSTVNSTLYKFYTHVFYMTFSYNLVDDDCTHVVMY
jgi:hypothetical protein